MKLGFDKRKIVEPESQTPVGSRFATFAAAGGHSRAPFRVAGDRQLDGARFAGELSVEQGDVDLLHSAFAKILHELFVRGVCERDNDQTGRIFIEPMHNPRAKRTAQRRQLFRSAEVMEQRGNQSAGILTGAGMNDHSGRLIDHSDVRVAINNFERDIFRLDADGSCLWNFDEYFFAELQTMGGLFGDVVDADAAFVDQVLDLIAADVRESRDQITIEAFSGFRFSYNVVADACGSARRSFNDRQFGFVVELFFEFRFGKHGSW